MGDPLFVLGPVVLGVPRCCVGGSPPVPLLRAVGACCWVGGPPPPSPTWRLHALSARDRLGGTLASVCLPPGSCAGSARCGVSSPSSSVPLLLCPRSLLVLRGPMAVLSAGSPRVGLTSLRRLRRQSILVAPRKRAMLGPGAVGAVGLRWPGPLAAVFLYRLHCRRRLHHLLFAPWRAVAAFGSLPPG